MNWLKETRKKKNLTVKEVANRVGCSDIFIYKIEAGERNPSVPVAKSIAKILEFHWTKFYD